METLSIVQPIAQEEARSESPETLRLVEMMLKAPEQLDELVRNEAWHAELIPRFLAIGLIGFTIFGVAATVVLNAAGVWPAWVPAAHWSNATAANLVLAYDLGLIAGTGICLPSFYFFGLLAGFKPSMLQVSTLAAKCLATTAVVLVGILPVYVAIALGTIVFQAAPESTEFTIGLGLALPFVAGLWGVSSLLRGFLRLCDALPPARRARRRCFARRLILAWSACYTGVTPVMIATLWKHLSG